MAGNIKVTTAPACETKYLGPTDSRGARVKATHFNTRRTITRPWDHGLDANPNHAIVAAELLGSTDLLCCSVDGGGWVWMVRR